MAPSRAAATTTWVTDAGSAMSPPMVLATPTPANAPTKLQTAAMSTAVRPGRTLVDTTVATAFAVSWNPLTESKARASTTTRTRRARPLSILPHHRADDVHRVLALVDPGLQAEEHVLLADQLGRRHPVGEQGGNGPAVDGI